MSAPVEPGGSPVRPAQLLAPAVRRLAAAGVDAPAVDARDLLAHVLGVGRGALVLVDDVPTESRTRFEELIGERERRVPLQHLLGTAAFGPVTLQVGPGVFVPRPETEALLEWAVAAARTSGARTAVDLCSGSGALAIGLATLAPALSVTAVEIDPAAARYLLRNVAAQPADVRARLRVVVADACGDPAALGGPYDLVVSNPPYVPAGTDVPPEVHADPARAVFAGADGMSVIRPLLGGIRVIAPGAPVGVEHDDATAAEVVAACRAIGFSDVTERRDLAGRPRFVTALVPNGMIVP